MGQGAHCKEKRGSIFIDFLRTTGERAVVLWGVRPKMGACGGKRTGAGPTFGDVDNETIKKGARRVWGISDGCMP